MSGMRRVRGLDTELLGEFEPEESVTSDALVISSSARQLMRGMAGACRDEE